MEAVLERPTLQDQRVAKESLHSFIKATAETRSDRMVIQIQESKDLITIPTKTLDLLSFILSSMAAGKAISLIPSDSEISTQQAADMLNVSRPFIVKLLEKGEIPFKKVGSHRRILLEDLLTYEKQQKVVRKEKLRYLGYE